MKIAFDVDGVVLKSIDIILDHINYSTGRSLKPEELTNWDLEPLGLEPSVLREAVNYMYSLPRIESYSEAPEVLSRIHRITGEPLLFITGRTKPETAHRQLEALPWRSQAPEMIVIGGNRDKRRFLADSSAGFIIEDDPEYADAYLDEGIGVGLMVQPWNSRVQTRVTTKFTGWHDVESWFLEMREKA